MINLADTFSKIVENDILKWKSTLKATRYLLTCKHPPTRLLLVAIWISHQKVMTSSWRFTQIKPLHVHVPVHVWNRNLSIIKSAIKSVSIATIRYRHGKCASTNFFNILKSFSNMGKDLVRKGVWCIFVPLVLFRYKNGYCNSSFAYLWISMRI